MVQAKVWMYTEAQIFSCTHLKMLHVLEDQMGTIGPPLSQLKRSQKDGYKGSSLNLYGSFTEKTFVKQSMMLE